MPRWTAEQSARRSALEYAIIMRELRDNRDAFMARLTRNSQAAGECRIWTARTNDQGYPDMSFRFEGKHVRLYVHRIAIILRTGQPIPPLMESGHYHCFDRRCIVHVQLEDRQTNLAVRDQRQRWKREQDVPRGT